MGGTGGGGCCTQKCTCGGHDTHTAKVDRIMVRFRPIAPKPAVGGSGSGSGSAFGNNNSFFSKPRPKRRYVRVKNKNCRNKIDDAQGRNSESDRSDDTEMVTLSLLPETPGSLKDVDLTSSHSHSHSQPIRDVLTESDRKVVKTKEDLQMKGSIVIVECVEGLGTTQVIDLENDTCPGFISDGYNRVWWTNRAYKMMIGSEMVRLVMEDRFPLMCSAFVCRVRLQYSCEKERKSMIVPCDVWRIRGGEFAWRLDVQAALSLGR